MSKALNVHDRFMYGVVRTNNVKNKYLIHIYVQEAKKLIVCLRATQKFNIVTKAINSRRIYSKHSCLLMFLAVGRRRKGSITRTRFVLCNGKFRPKKKQQQ